MSQMMNQYIYIYNFFLKQLKQDEKNKLGQYFKTNTILEVFHTI